MTTLAVIAKAPVPGRSKTRLCPPLTPQQAADLAEAALCDSLAAALATVVSRVVLVLDGPPGEWLPKGVEIIPQRGRGLAERLAAAFEDIAAPALLIGMDTPQVTPEFLSGGLAALARGSRGVLGLAPDGGYWAIGLAEHDPRCFRDVPMSTSRTGAVQLQRLRDVHGHEPHMLPELRDVDLIDDAYAAAAAAPDSFFSTALRRATGSRRAAA